MYLASTLWRMARSHRPRLPRPGLIIAEIAACDLPTGWLSLGYGISDWRFSLAAGFRVWRDHGWYFFPKWAMLVVRQACPSLVDHVRAALVRPRRGGLLASQRGLETSGFPPCLASRPSGSKSRRCKIPRHSRCAIDYLV